jgi:hypothetical protein
MSELRKGIKPIALWSLGVFLLSVGLLCAGAVRELALPFHWRLVEWELAVRSGNLCLDNQRRVLLRQRLEWETDQQEEPIREELGAAPWGSPAYRRALSELHQLQDSAAAQRAKIGTPTRATRLVEHTVSLWRVAMFSAFLPLL